MTINNTRLRKALKKVAEPQTGWLDIFPAVIGKEDGTVLTAIPGEIYVRNVLNGQTLTVHNTVAPNIATLQVEVGRRVERPGLWQIKGIREVFNSPAGGNYISFHGSQHTYPATDTVWVDRKQILPLTVLVSDAAGFIVQVYGAVVRTGTGIAMIETQEVDLSSYVPATGAVYVGIETDDAGVLTVNEGTGFAAPELATAADVPVPAAGQYQIAFVLLTEAQTALENEDVAIPWALPGGAGAGDLFEGGSGGVVGRVAEFVTDDKHLQAAKIIGPATNILTILNSGAKSVTFPGSTNDTVAMLATANVFTEDNRGKEFIGTRSATITRTGAYISSVAKAGGRTITITRDGSNYITSVSDGTNTWTMTRNGSNQITAVTVT